MNSKSKKLLFLSVFFISIILISNVMSFSDQFINFEINVTNSEVGYELPSENTDYIAYLNKYYNPNLEENGYFLINSIEDYETDISFKTYQFKLELNKNSNDTIGIFNIFQYKDNSTYKTLYSYIFIQYSNVFMINLTTFMTNELYVSEIMELDDLFSFITMTFEVNIIDNKIYLRFFEKEHNIKTFYTISKEFKQSMFISEYIPILNLMTYSNVFLISQIHSFRLCYNSENTNSSSGFIDSFLDVIQSSNWEEEYQTWSYSSFSINSSETRNQVYENFNITLDTLEVVSENRLYYYNTEFIDLSDWGNWGMFDWLRRGLIYVFNTIIFLAQGLMYLLTIAFNYLLVWTFSQIIVIIWNLVLVNLIFAVLFLIDWLWTAFLLLWDGVMLIFNYIMSLLPISAEAIGNIFELVSLFLITAFSIIISALIWVISLGSIDFDVLLNSVIDFSFGIYSGIETAFNILIKFIPYMFLYIIFFINIILLLYLKIMYVKAKGFPKRAEELEKTLDSYMEIIRLGKSIVIFIRDLIPII